MARPEADRNRLCWLTPQICAIICIAALGVLPVVGGYGSRAHAGELVRTSDNSALWRWILQQIGDLDLLIGAPAQARLAGLESESDAAAAAQGLASDYQRDGFRDDLTDDDVSHGIMMVSDLRRKILSNPAEFGDPCWDSFLITLDQMEAELRARRGSEGGES